MKNRIVLSVAVVAVAGIGLALSARGQNNAVPAPSAHKVGLIDMAHIFKEYQRFQAVRDDVKADLARNEQKAAQMLGAMNALNGELQQLKQGTPAYAAKEKQLLQMNSELESFRRNAQREMLTKESDLYRQIYVEVSEAVDKYAHHYNYTLILKFVREEIEDAKEPQQVLNQLNKQVVHYRAEDDVTQSVLDYLHRQQTKASPKAEASDTTRRGVAPRSNAGGK